ncbi:hypothetical protein HELRODRAFT_114688 [Helobdella robusta]|uniref:Pseudouridine synthase II N-terminal domain-containing protein n=1 Tax=Helobdella robusta TaxID=6412 RepID=T1EG40_HELRO|nr:hypothetical protein HELRODRAFT_114688 [Helobdella robusta]ESN95538.1 hypothetical protein HELRODRAFT_114688 [Helobdella robusta]
MMKKASSLYEALNGVFSVYKPAGKSLFQVIQSLKLNLAKELNKLPCRPMRQRLVIDDGNLPMITTVPDLSDHVLVVGKRFIEDDIELSCVDAMNKASSGVTIFGIGRGVSLIRPICKAKYMKVYHVTGELGLATSSCWVDGRVIERSTFHHLTAARMDRVVAGIQSGHQKHMFKASGVDLQSEEAYQLACRGLLRPIHHLMGPVIYGMRCIHFEPPLFTLEIHSINETCDYLSDLVHNIGIELRTNAACSKLRRIRHGRFHLRNTLLLKHACDPEHLANQISAFRNLLSRDKVTFRPNINYLKDDRDGDVRLLDGGCENDAFISDDVCRTDDAKLIASS